MEYCSRCKYQDKREHEAPCAGCIHNALENFEPMTNADRIRSMTDEELAKFLEAVTCETHGWCNECKSLKGDYCHGLNDESNSLVQERLKWLKSEVGCE